MRYSSYEKETTINFCDAEQTAIIETYQQTWIRKILKAREKAIKNGYPDAIIINRQSEDMIEATVPKKFIRLFVPAYISPERRERMSETARQRWANKKDDTEDIIDEDDDMIDEEDYDSEENALYDNEYEA